MDPDTFLQVGGTYTIQILIPKINYNVFFWVFLITFSLTCTLKKPIQYDKTQFSVDLDSYSSLKKLFSVTHQLSQFGDSESHTLYNDVL